MKILVMGAGGYVGSFLSSRIGRDGDEVVVSSARLSRSGESLSYVQPDVVVNCAGRTGRPNVDWCETHVAETYESNVAGAITLGVECQRRGVHLVHIGSGCVFFGENPLTPFGSWNESHAPNPRTVYTRSKYAADLALLDLGAAVLRIRSPISGTPHPRNLLSKVRSYDSVVSSRPSVTWLDELPTVVRALIDRRAVGLFHAVNPGQLQIAELKSPGARVISEETLRAMTACERSSATVTSVRLAELGVSMTHIADALPTILERYEAREDAGRRREAS